MAYDDKEKKSDQERLNALNEEASLREKVLDRLISQRAATDQLTTASKSLVEAGLEAEKLRYEMALKSGEATDEELAGIQELIKTAEQRVVALTRQSQAQDNLNKRIDSFAAKAGASIPILEDLADAKFSVSELAGKMKDAFSDANGKLDLLKVTSAITAPVFNAVRDALIMNAKAVADMTAEVASATGEGMKYNSMISSVGTANREFGVGMVEAGRAVIALKDNMSTFNMVGDDTSQKMLGVSARMETLGVSAADSGAQMEFAMRIMGQTGDQAAQGVDDLAKFAGGIGVAPAKMAKEFQAAAPALASYGKNATKVFKGLAVQSKKLGLSMNELLGITQQFDTFDGAFDAAGKLNSMLGGQFLDSMQLLTAETEEQRVQLLQNALAMSGQSFDAMSRHEKMAVANSIGITDMSVATKLLSESNRALGKDVKENSLSQEELAERQKAGVTFTKKMEMAMQGFAIALMPVAEIMHSVASGLVAMTNNSFVQFLIGSAAAVYMLVKAVQIARAATTAYFAVKMALGAVESGSIVTKALMATKNYILAGSQAAVTGTAATMGPALTASGAAGGAASPGIAALAVAMLKLGVAVFLIGAGIGILAAGMSLLVNAFAALLQIIIDNIKIMPQVIISLYLLAIGFQLLGASLLIAGLGMYVFTASLLTMVLIGVPAIMAMLIPMLLFGLAVGGVALSMLMLGIGIMTAAVGVGMIVKNFSGLTTMLPDIVQSFGLLAATFASMAASIVLLGYVMGTFGGAIAVLAIPLMLIGMTIIGIALAIKSMAAAISEMGVDNAMVTFMTTVNSVDDGKVENLEEMMDQAQRYVFIQAQMNAMEIANSIADGIGSLFGIGGDADSPAGQNQKEIVLKLNEREFARAVVESLDGQTKISLA